MKLASFKELLKTKKLLIVEDEKIQLEFLHDEISPLLIACDGAASVDEARNLLDNNDYDFLISDVHLTCCKKGYLKGLRVMSEAKLKHQYITVLGMSTDDSVPLIEAMDHFIRKPLLSADAIAAALLVAYERNL